MLSRAKISWLSPWMTDNRIKGTQIGDSLIQSIDNLISTLQYLSNLDNQEPFYRNTKGCQSKLQLWIVTVTIQCVNHDFLRRNSNVVGGQTIIENGARTDLWFLWSSTNVIHSPFHLLSFFRIFYQLLPWEEPQACFLFQQDLDGASAKAITHGSANHLSSSVIYSCCPPYRTVDSSYLENFSAHTVCSKVLLQ